MVSGIVSTVAHATLLHFAALVNDYKFISKNAKQGFLKKQGMTTPFISIKAQLQQCEHKLTTESQDLDSTLPTARERTTAAPDGSLLLGNEKMGISFPIFLLGHEVGKDNKVPSWIDQEVGELQNFWDQSALM